MITIATILLLISSLLIACTSTSSPVSSPTPTPSPAPNLTRALSYLYDSYDPEMKLLYEAPTVARNTYWLVSDNLLAMYVFKQYYPEIASDIENRLMEITSKYDYLPKNDEGLPISNAHEALIGETIPLPFKSSQEYTLEQGEGFAIKTTVYDGENMLLDWEQYADLLIYAALSKHWEMDSSSAQERMKNCVLMWDGIGISDTVFPKYGKYSTYKLGLLLYASEVIGYPLEFEDELITRLKSMQAESGGFITDYLPDGTPEGDTNTETTAIAVLALETAN